MGLKNDCNVHETRNNDNPGIDISLTVKLPVNRKKIQLFYMLLTVKRMELEMYYKNDNDFTVEDNADLAMSIDSFDSVLRRAP